MNLSLINLGVGFAISLWSAVALHKNDSNKASLALVLAFINFIIAGIVAD